MTSTIALQRTVDDLIAEYDAKDAAAADCFARFSRLILSRQGRLHDGSK